MVRGAGGRERLYGGYLSGEDFFFGGGRGDILEGDVSGGVVSRGYPVWEGISKGAETERRLKRS